MCPRCKRNYYKTINVYYKSNRVSMNKCLECGFLFVPEGANITKSEANKVIKLLLRPDKETDNSQTIKES